MYQCRIDAGEQMVSISSNGDLNSLTENRRYVSASGTVTNTLANLPLGFPNSAFVMDVVPIGVATGSNCAQIIYTRNNVTPLMFIRILGRDAVNVGSWYSVTLAIVSQ